MHSPPVCNTANPPKNVMSDRAMHCGPCRRFPCKASNLQGTAMRSIREQKCTQRLRHGIVFSPDARRHGGSGHVSLLGLHCIWFVRVDARKRLFSKDVVEERKHGVTENSPPFLFPTKVTCTASHNICSHCPSPTLTRS